MVIIRSKRIILRKLKKDDYQDIYQNISKDVVRWLPNIHFPYSIDDAKSYIKLSVNNFRKKRTFDFGIIFERRVIGTISLENIDKHRKARLSYLLNKNYWNKGIITEAINKILEFGFKKIQLNKIFTSAVVENKISIHVLKKFGFKKEGVNRKHYLIRKKYYDEVILSLLKEGN